ncbi:MAG: hypothetical protein JWM36_3357 [Hyphomicrobiales bacterium]|nr:hypothetical protein [Hyphomicrobiales bacterium]
MYAGVSEEARDEGAPTSVEISASGALPSAPNAEFIAEGVQPEIVSKVISIVAELRASFEKTADVTVPEFMKLSQARDDLADLVRRMYEQCVYKDD